MKKAGLNWGAGVQEAPEPAVLPDEKKSDKTDNNYRDKQPNESL